MKFYAIRKGRKTGVFTSWNEVQTYISNYHGAEYKGFETRSDAEHWVSEHVSNLPKEFIKVYIDGSTINNGKSKTGNSPPTGGFGVFYADDHPRNASRALPSETVTNNRAELCAFIHVLKHNKKKHHLLIVTDSKYNINCFNGVRQWKKNDWNLASGKPASNIDLLEKLYKHLEKREWKGVTLQKVDAHQPKPNKDDPKYADWYGNDMADRLSKRAGKI